MRSMTERSLLSVIERCDNFRRETAQEKYTELRLTADANHINGLISEEVLVALQASDNVDNPVWDIRPASASSPGFITFNSRVNTPALRSEALKTIVEGWRDNGLFSNQISHRLWRDELYTVFKNAFGPRTEDNTAFYLERTACALFGLVTYGVHLTMYTQDGKIWVPTRAKTKQTWPLYLDNSVAGGIPHGMTPFEAIVKECNEEANLDEDFVRAHAKSCGAVTYYFKSEKGYLQPEVQFIYDLPVPIGQEERYIPRPLDGEVESFTLDTLEYIIEKMHEEKFKPNCALVMVDFMIRHGKITSENEPNYLEIMTRLHGRFGYE